MSSTAKKTIIFIGISLIINILLIVLAIIISNKITVQSRTISTQVAALNKRNLSTENLRESLARIKTVGARIDNIDKYLFTAGEELSLITDLENIAAKNKISYKVASSNLDNYQNNRLDIILNVDGPLSGIIKYLSDLESYKYVVSIQRIEFAPSGSLNQENSSQINVNMRLILFLYAQPTK
ncbi:MAG: hypothetical protein NTW66_01585 [Candidatus Magasanikbacteria bacterium]|nr:hypothetical protein [Candidatus Magasanikbacteria bacterium]